MPSRLNSDQNLSHLVQPFIARTSATPVIQSVRRIALYMLAGALVSLALIKPLYAQSSASSGEGPGHVFTLNPFFVLAGWISGEYEQRVNSTLTLGAGASYVDFNDNRYTSFD